MRYAKDLDSMRLLILSEDFEGIRPWLFSGAPPEGMPAVYHHFQYLSSSDKHGFEAIIINKKVTRVNTLLNGSQIRLHRLIPLPHYLWKFLSFFHALYLGYRMCRTQKFDVVYGMGFYGFAATLIARFCNLPSINRKYGCLMYDLITKKRYMRLFTRHIFEIAAFKFAPNLVIATQAGMRTEEVARYFNPSISIRSLYNGIDSNFKAQLLKIPLLEEIPGIHTKLIIGYIARLGISKRQDLAIDVIDHLVNRLNCRQVELQIIGSGAHQKRIQKQIASKGLTDFIRVIPAQPQNRLPGILATQHIALFCYDGGVMGNILWESMLAGRLICLRATGEHHLFGPHNSIKVAADDSAVRMAEAIHNLIGTEVTEICRKSRQLANQLINDYRNRFAEEMEIIEKLL